MKAVEIRELDMRAALREIRRARAIHLCGDQHLAVTVKHGIDEHGDGPYGFTSPALVNTVYARWWHPKDERAGANPVQGSPLPWTGDYLDGLGNRISMMAYANPPEIKDERNQVRHLRGVTDSPGLYLLGMTWQLTRTSALLRRPFSSNRASITRPRSSLRAESLPCTRPRC